MELNQNKTMRKAYYYIRMELEDGPLFWRDSTKLGAMAYANRWSQNNPGRVVEVMKVFSLIETHPPVPPTTITDLED